MTVLADDGPSTGGTASVGEDFSMLGYKFIYDQEESQNPPFGYVITEEAISAFGSSLNDAIVYALSSFGKIVKFELFSIMYLFWNGAFEDNYYVNGKLYNDATTIYYYLIDDDGDIFNWCFEYMGIKVTLQLDENGLPWTNGKGQPNGNVKHSSQSLEILEKAQRQQTIDNKIWVPRLKTGSSFSNLPAPYIIGKSLYFYVEGNTLYKPSAWFQVVDFSNTFINYGSNSTSASYRYPTFYFISPDHSISIINHGTTGYQSNWQINSSTGFLNISSIHGNWNNSSGYYAKLEAQGGSSSQLISFNLPFYSTNGISVGTNHAQNNYDGVINYVAQVGDGDIYLDGQYYYTVTDPSVIVIPEDDPISIPDIGDWVDENVPDDEPDGDDDPVPVQPIVPDPGPDPVPDTPALPPIVSGNDDLWPDVNIVFDFEADLDGFLGPLFDFEFPDFNNVIANFVGPLTWISGIMTLLFEGSELNVLFTVVAILFIASALLGIYKWWK